MGKKAKAAEPDFGPMLALTRQHLTEVEREIRKHRATLQQTQTAIQSLESRRDALTAALRAAEPLPAPEKES